MNCIKCEYLGHSGGHLVCGYLLHGGETVYIKCTYDAQLPFQLCEPCPLDYLKGEETYTTYTGVV